MDGLKFPHKCLDLDIETKKEVSNIYKGTFIQVGPKKWFLPFKYSKEAHKFYDFKVRQDDIWLVTYPRSGTTMMLEIVWLIVNNCDFKAAEQMRNLDKVPFFEYNMLRDNSQIEELMKSTTKEEKLSQLKEVLNSQLDKLDKMQDRRIIRTHLPFSLLPPDLTKTAGKVIYIARNPKDVAVSYFHFLRFANSLSLEVKFDEFWEYFRKDLATYSPYFEHVKEGWERRHFGNFLFLFYEDIVTDLRASIGKVSQFLGKSLNGSELQRIADHMNFEKFKLRQSKSPSVSKELFNTNEPGFVRKGVNQGWKEYFSEKMNQEAEQWIQGNLESTDMKFPSI